MRRFVGTACPRGSLFKPVRQQPTCHGHQFSRVVRSSSDLSSAKPQPGQAPRSPASRLDTTPSADHRQLGTSLELFRPTKSSPGSMLFGPAGTHILLKLQQFLRAQYVQFGFQEVITPIIYKQSLWEQSGHWEHYANDMYEVVGRGASGQTRDKEIGEDEKYGLKPMNCPGHCLLYSSQPRSYRDLPIRFADFSPLHRNEISGALSGLTRVRRFHQDDGHIFCLPHQVKDEIKSCLKFVDLVYGVFGFDKYSLVLSTRPEKDYMGSIEAWDRAESQLKEALDQSGIPWTLNPGDGAFYGPKIDIVLQDRNGKSHQTATIQLDFQLPQRMDLEYRSGKTDMEEPNEDSNPTDIVHRPVMIHRAVLGSLERFFALLIERTMGRWPIWLNPRQVVIIPKSSEELAYAKATAQLIKTGGTGESDQPSLRPLHSEAISVSLDESTDQSISSRIKDAHLWKYGVKVVIGPRERQSASMAVDVSGIPDHESCVPEALQDLGLVDAAEEARRQPKKLQLQPDQLRQLILHLEKGYR